MQKFFHANRQKITITTGLFLIGALHTMLFSTFQVPKNFLMGHSSSNLEFWCKVLLYTCAISVSLLHQWMCRTLGLRKVLYCGLLLNLFGMTTLFLSTLGGGKGPLLLVFLNMIFFGAALTSVINSLVTYIIVEFPKRVGVVVVVLFVFFNLGAMLAPLIQDTTPAIIYSVLGTLLLLGIWFVHVFFFDLPLSARRIHMEKGSLIWKQLHYRLLLLCIAIIAYALTETTFNVWGYVDLISRFGLKAADHTIPTFWFFLIVGQITLLIPLYFFPPKRIFYFLILVIIAATFMYPLQTDIKGFITWLAIAGFGCSAVFPILLSQMEKELFPIAKGKNIYSYIEKSISLLFACYFTGVGIIDIWALQFGPSAASLLTLNFRLAAIFIVITGLISLFLDFTVEKT